MEMSLTLARLIAVFRENIVLGHTDKLLPLALAQTGVQISLSFTFLGVMEENELLQLQNSLLAKTELQQ